MGIFLGDGIGVVRELEQAGIAIRLVGTPSIWREASSLIF
jgi:hypothetical protein